MGEFEDAEHNNASVKPPPLQHAICVPIWLRRQDRFAYWLHAGSPEQADAEHAVNTPSHVTPCPSVPEHVVPEHDTEVEPEHGTVQTAN